VTRIPTMLMGADGPEHLPGRRVVRSLACLQCGYDLNGAEAMGRCSECGMPVPFSLAGSIDPLVHSLSPIPNPRAVGRGLLAAACVLAMLPTAILMWGCWFVWYLSEGSGSGRRFSLPPVPVWLPDRLWWYLALVILALGGVALWCFKPQARGRVPVGTVRSVLLLAIGVLLSALAVAVIPVVSSGSKPWLLVASPLFPLPGLAIMLVGFRGVLLDVGKRSSTFRRAKVRRQRIPPLLAAIGLVAVAWVSLLLSLQMGESLRAISLAVGLLALIFVTIGCWYLLLNAWWIYAALQTPPERLRDLLTEAEPLPSD
jgi:hypothetical protein